MKKFFKMFSLIIIIGMVVSYYMVQFTMQQENELSDIFLQNIEAIASGEGGSNDLCYGYGSLDCPQDHVKVEYISSMRLDEFE